MADVQARFQEIQKLLTKYSLENLPEHFRNWFFLCKPCGKSFLLPAFLHHKFNFEHTAFQFRETVLANVEPPTGSTSPQTQLHITNRAETYNGGKSLNKLVNATESAAGSSEVETTNRNPLYLQQNERLESEIELSSQKFSAEHLLSELPGKTGRSKIPPNSTIAQPSDNRIYDQKEKPRFRNYESNTTSVKDKNEKQQQVVECIMDAGIEVGNPPETYEDVPCREPELLAATGDPADSRVIRAGFRAPTESTDHKRKKTKEIESPRRLNWRSKVTVQSMGPRSLVKETIPVSAYMRTKDKLEEPNYIRRPFLEAAEEVAGRNAVVTGRVQRDSIQDHGTLETSADIWLAEASDGTNFLNDTNPRFRFSQRIDYESYPWQMEPFFVSPTTIVEEGQVSLRSEILDPMTIECSSGSNRNTEFETILNQTIDLCESIDEGLGLKSGSDAVLSQANLQNCQSQSPKELGKSTAVDAASEVNAFSILDIPLFVGSTDASGSRNNEKDFNKAEGKRVNEVGNKTRARLEAEHSAGTTPLPSSPIRAIAAIKPSVRLRSDVVGEVPAKQTKNQSDCAEGLSKPTEIPVNTMEILDLPYSKAQSNSVAGDSAIPYRDSDISVEILDTSSDGLSSENAEILPDCGNPKTKRQFYRLPNDFIHFCNPCNREFRDAYNLKLHNRARHSGLFPFHCSICSKGFTLRCQLQACEEMHDRGSEFMCQECHLFFNKAEKLRKHREQVHESESDKKPNYSASYAGEVWTAETIEALCAPLSSVSRGAVKTTETVQNPPISKSTRKEPIYEAPIVGVTSQAPTQCPATIIALTEPHPARPPNKKTLQVHFSSDQTNDGSSITTGSDVPEPSIWFCQNQNCRKQFTSEHQAQVHQKSCQKCCCPHCPKKYSQNQTLQQHILQEHREYFCATGKVIYQCPHCHKEFIRKADFEGHFATHTGFRPFRCKQCDKSFNHRSDLSTHQKAANHNNN